MTPAELPAYLRRLAAEVKDRAALDAAQGMADTFMRSVRLSMTGPAPSPPGSPPARRTGTLSRSVVTEPAALIGAGRAASSVAPHAVYARIQQTGGDIYPVRAKVLHWKDKGGSHWAKHVHLPARPYMVMTGQRRTECRSAAVSAVQAVVREALRG